MMTKREAVGADRVRLSVLIPALNQEVNIGEALRSVGWADEAWVVDSKSSDRTVAIASQLGAEVVQFDYPGSGPRKIAWALQNLPMRNEWVLLLGPPERVPGALRDEIAAAVSSNRAEAYFLRRSYSFLGRTLRCTRNEWHLRLFKRALSHYERLPSSVPDMGDTEIQERIIVAGQVAHLRSSLLHCDLRPVRTFVEEQARSCQWEAELYWDIRAQRIPFEDFFSHDLVSRSRARKHVWARLPFRPVGRFLVSYVIRGGFLDGRAGLAYSAFAAYKEFLISLSLHEYEAILQRAKGKHRLERADRNSQGEPVAHRR